MIVPSHMPYFGLVEFLYHFGRSSRKFSSSLCSGTPLRHARSAGIGSIPARIRVLSLRAAPR